MALLDDDDMGDNTSSGAAQAVHVATSFHAPRVVEVPEVVTRAIGQARFIRGMMDVQRAAKALDLPVRVYEQLAGDHSRVQRRVVSMAAEQLGLGVSAGMHNRLQIPFPKSGIEVLAAARALGLIAALYAHGGMMVRAEMMQLSNVFGDENVKFASRHRRIAQTLPVPTFKWPPSVIETERYGANLLVSWAHDAAPALANLLKIAMPPAYGNQPMPLSDDMISLDRIILDVLKQFWGEADSSAPL